LMVGYRCGAPNRGSAATTSAVPFWDIGRHHPNRLKRVDLSGSLAKR
jgi:hypothetical protein